MNTGSFVEIPHDIVTRLEGRNSFMVIIDKAVWQIDGGIPEDLVISHFNTVFTWLDDHKMLSVEGKEELEKI